MPALSATAFRQNLYQTIADVNESCTPLVITNTKGKNAVLIGEDDWRAIEETLYLNSIPGFADSLIENAQEPFDNCVSASELDW
jgi:PHD/YefM family antitoxin component YafN of YafNO toxin-antitoxin module